MPISSGALAWPASYYSKPELDNKEAIDDGQWSPGKGTPPRSHEWQPKLTNREEYERWRKRMDRKDPLKTRRKNRGGCFAFFTSQKLNTENEDPAKGEQRDSPREVIKRRRRRWCFLLAFAVSALCCLIMTVFLVIFLRYAGHEVIGPEDLVECTGRWRDHFLGYADRQANGSVFYTCCYLPNLPNATVWSAQSSSQWPDGYLYTTQADCTPDPAKTKCEDYTAADFGKVSMPMPPCKGAATTPANIFMLLLLALLSFTLGYY